MKILLLTRYLAEGVGGAELVVTLLAKHLASHGHKVWIITNKIEGILCPTHENIKIIFVDTHTILDVKHWKQHKKISYNLSAIKKGLSLIKKEKIDLIHSNPNQPALSGYLLSLFTRKHHIVTIHGTNSINQRYLNEWAKQKGNSKWKAKLGYFIAKFIFKLNYSAIHAVSDAVKDELINLKVKPPIYVIPNGIPIKNSENFEIKLHQLIIISRLEFFKNVQIVIKSIKIVKESFPKVKLIILGDGGYRKNLEKLVSQLELENNVEFKGYIYGKEKNQYLSESQALLFPSFYEGFGMVILEAYLQKKPVLVSNIHPLNDIVENHKTGLIVPSNDEKEWTKAIKQILKEPSIGKTMGENGRILLEQKYSLELINQKIIKMYEEVIFQDFST